MPKIRNVSPYGDLDTPLLRAVVKAGETVTVSDEQADVLLAQLENWAPADPAAKKITAAHVADQAAREQATDLADTTPVTDDSEATS